MATDPQLAAALAYAKRGWHVFPLNGKHPFEGSHGHKDATTDPAVIRRWWKGHPRANVGIACSSVHGPLVLDVDGPDAEALVRTLDLPATREATSGRPHRRHLYFAPDGAPIKRQTHVRPQLDVLGDGGYVVAPPSIHPATGRAYRWSHNGPPAPLPAAVRALVAPPKARTQAPPLPDVLREGERDDQLTSLAGSMRRRGASETAILAALRAENRSKCVPPLPDAQVVKIARSVARYAPAADDERLDDIGNARRFVRLHAAEVRYVQTWRSWLAWDGRRWQRDATREAERRAEDVVRDLYEAAARATSDDDRKRLGEHAKRTANQRKRSDLLETAKHQREIVVRPEQLDTDPWLLNVENGTLDLRTGELRPHQRDDLLTKLAPVIWDPHARAPRWQEFLRQITRDDREVIAFLQRAVGYTLTGSTREECLLFCYGTGQNGKTTFLETLRALLGDYAVQVPFDALLNRSGDGAQERYMAIMPNARFVTAIEASKGRPFNESLVKWLTSSDRQVARRLYENPFEFAPTHKLWLGANHQPPVRDQSVAFWRRMKLVPFTVTIPPSKRDKDLRDKLRDELPGILRWALAGCLAWQRTNDLAEPKAVRLATRTYRIENDPVDEFFEARCLSDPAAWVPTGSLYPAFAEWWTETNSPRSIPPRRDTFVQWLKERPRLRAAKRGGIRGWVGLKLRNGGSG